MWALKKWRDEVDSKGAKEPFFKESAFHCGLLQGSIFYSGILFRRIFFPQKIISAVKNFPLKINPAPFKDISVAEGVLCSKIIFHGR